MTSLSLAWSASFRSRISVAEPIHPRFRYPELLKPPDTAETQQSDRNSSYDNVERRQGGCPPSTTSTMSTNLTVATAEPRRDRSLDPSESETLLDTDDSDVDRIKRSRSFRERNGPLSGEYFFSLWVVWLGGLMVA